MIHVAHPSYLLLLLALLAFTLWMSRRLGMLDKRRRWTAILLRCLILTLAILTLAEARLTRTSERLTAIYVYDDSDSVPGELKQQAQEFIRASLEKKPARDKLGLLVFAGDASMEYSPRERLEQLEFRSVVNRNQTNISSALRLALAAFGEETRKRIVLISDGNQTQGYAAEIAREAKSHGAVIDVYPLRYSHRNDIVVEKLVTPGKVNLDEPFNMRIFVRSLVDTQARLTVQRNGQSITEPLLVNLTGGEKNAFILPTQIPAGADEQSFHNFSVRIDPVSGDADSNPENNRAHSFTWTSGKPRVLLIRGDVDTESHLAAALLNEEIRVELRGEDGIPQNYEELLNYDTIIFENVAAHALTRTQMQWIENAVHELGIGFIMVGGENAFGAGGYQDSPIEDALPVSMDIKQKKVIPKGALCLILHTCEFADGNKWARDIARAALDVLSSRDMMGVLYYSYQGGGESWLYEIQEVRDKTRMRKLITTCNPGDMPSFDPTLRMAHKGLAQSNASVKHLVIISDGDPGRPTPDLVQAVQADRISISTICINPHSGSDTSIMQELARIGNGRYYNPRDPRTLPQIFIKEASMVRKTLIVEETFTPNYQQQTEPLAGYGAEDFPALDGYVATTRKDLADVPLVTHEDDPLLAHWRYGVGKTVAFTSDVKNRWAARWLSWDAFGKFWSQLVRWSMRSLETGNYQLTTAVESGRGSVVIDALNPEDEADFEAIVITPQLERLPLAVRQTAAGRWEGAFDAEQIGTYLVRLQPKGSPQVLTGGVSMSYSPEFNAWKSDEALLINLAEESGGRVLDGAADVFEHNLPPARESEPIWPLTMALTLLLVPFDVFVRRVMLDWAMVRGMFAFAWAKSFEWLGLAFRRDKKTDETVDALLDVKRRVREQRTAPSAGEAQPAAAAPPQGKQDRLAALDEMQSRAGVLDSARKTEAKPRPPAQKPPADAPKADAPAGDIDRLLAAKQRALKKRKP